MNVLEEINKGINPDWSMAEKRRYIYLMSCKYFSYDKRGRFAKYGKREIECFDNLKKQVIEIENVTNDSVICTNHTRDVIDVLYQRLLGIKGIIHENYHSYLRISESPFAHISDSTKYSDLARVKLNLPTKGYHLDLENKNLNQTEKISIERKYNQKLFHIDQKINYIQANYQGFHLVQNFLNQVKCYTDSKYFVRKAFQELKNSIDALKFTHYSDIEFAIYYFLSEFQRIYPFNIDVIYLFDSSNIDHWNYFDIFVVRLPNESLYYLFEEIDGKFLFHEISEYDANYYVKYLKGYNRCLLLS